MLLIYPMGGIFYLPSIDTGTRGRQFCLEILPYVSICAWSYCYSSLCGIQFTSSFFTILLSILFFYIPKLTRSHCEVDKVANLVHRFTNKIFYVCGICVIPITRNKIDFLLVHRVQIWSYLCSVLQIFAKCTLWS